MNENTNTQDAPKKIRICGLTNTAAVKRFALEVIHEKGKLRFNRVSKEFAERAEAHLRSWIRNEMHMHPSIGKTVK